MVSPPVSMGILGPRFKTGQGTKDTPEMWACYADVEPGVRMCKSILIEHIRKNQNGLGPFSVAPLSQGLDVI